MRYFIFEEGNYYAAQLMEIKEIKMVETKPDEEAYKKGARPCLEIVDAKGNEHLSGKVEKIGVIRFNEIIERFRTHVCNYCKGLGCIKCNSCGFTVGR